MLTRLTAALIFTCVVPLSALAQQAPVAYPPGTYPQQPPYPPQQVQPGQYPQQYPADPYAQPGAAPGYAPLGGYPPGYPGGLAGVEPLITSVAGLLQVSLGTYFLRYTSLSQSFDNNGGDFSRTDVNWGFSNGAPVILEGGYGLNDNMIVGGVLQLGGSSSTAEPDGGGAKRETSSFDLMLAPKFDYQFMPASKFNPFVGGLLGLEIGSLSATAAGVTTDDSTTMFTLLARGGVRCFLFDGFSIDPALVVGFRLGGGSQKTGDTPELDYGLSGFRVGLSVGVSGWLR
jgi:hypothetical protein